MANSGIRLDATEAERPRRLSERIGVQRAAKALDVAEGTYTRAASGAPVLRGTAVLVRMNLSAAEAAAI